MPAGGLAHGLPRHDQGNPVFWEGKGEFLGFLQAKATDEMGFNKQRLRQKRRRIYYSCLTMLANLISRQVF